MQAPLPVFVALLELAFAFTLFYWWRRWAPKGLANMRSKLIAARPRTRRRIRMAKLIWYLDQVRRPLEWLVLLAVIFAVIDLPGTGEERSG